MLVSHIPLIVDNKIPSETAKLRSSKTRDEILEELVELVVLYYDYNAELARYYLTLFSPQEAIAWFEANEKTRPVTLRVNTLKTRLPELAKALTVRGTTTAQVGAWTPEGLKVVDTTVPVGATPEYLGKFVLFLALCRSCRCSCGNN